MAKMDSDDLESRYGRRRRRRRCTPAKQKEEENRVERVSSGENCIYTAVARVVVPVG